MGKNYLSDNLRLKILETVGLDRYEETITKVFPDYEIPPEDLKESSETTQQSLSPECG